MSESATPAFVPPRATSRHRRFRICVIGDAESVHVLTRARAFAGRGHDVVLISERSAEIRDLTLRVPEPSHLPVLRSIDMLRQLGALLRRERADVYHVHYAASYGAWLAAALDLRPMVVSVMGGDILPDEQMPQGPLVRWLTRQVLRGANLVTSKSAYLTERLIRMGVDPDRILPVLWGIDLGTFRRRDGTRTRAALGIGLDTTVVLSPRNLRPFYNIHVLIDAFSVLVRDHPSVMLVIMEPKADADYRERLEDQAANLDLSGHVRFVGGVANESMPDYYSMADLVISLAPSDAIPTCVLEAMACETPVLLTRLNRYEELFREDDTVRMVEIDADRVAEEISRLIVDPASRRRLSSRGASLVRERADLEHHVDNVERAFFILAEDHATGARRARWPLFSLVILGSVLLVAVGFAVRSCIPFFRQNVRIHVAANGPS